MEKLKPCPFCGGDAKFETISKNSTSYSVGYSFIIQCQECKMKFPKGYNISFSLSNNGEVKFMDDERFKAIRDWNKRDKEDNK